MIAGQTTFSVKFCTASGGTLLVAVNTQREDAGLRRGPAEHARRGRERDAGRQRARLRHGRRREAGRRHRERAGGADGEGRRVRRW